MKCMYGCDKEALFEVYSNKWCCSDNICKCPAILSRINEKIKCEKCGRMIRKGNMKQHLKACSIEKICLYCGKTIKKNNKYCNSTCAAMGNKNRKGTGNNIYESFCLNCNKVVLGYKRKYCNRQCQSEYKYKENVRLWLNGEIDGSSPNGHAYYVKRWLMNKYNNSCQICGWSEVNPFSKTIPLNVHHVDGDWENNRPDNVQLLCPNCHSLTETFCGGNVNNKKNKIRPSLKHLYKNLKAPVAQ